MKQQHSSLLEAIGSIAVAILLFIFLNDYMLKYAFPVVFILLAIYKINEAIDYSKRK